MGTGKHPTEESAKHAKILEVAGKMFLAHSYSAISMDALAEAVPVSKRTLYNHFKDKKSLFTAVMQQRCRSVCEVLEHTLRQDSGVQQTLTRMGEQFLNVVFEPAAVNIYRVAIAQAQQFPELGTLFYESGPKRSGRMLADYFARLHANKELHIPNPELSANVFLSMLKNSLQMKCMLGLKKNVSAREKNDIIRYAVRMFLGEHRIKKFV